MTTRRARLSLLAVLLALPALMGLSSGEEAHGSASAALDFLGKAVNFVILFGALAFVLRKPLKAMLAQRTADIAETLRRIAADRSEAEAKASDSRSRIARLGEEVGRLKVEAEEEARREAERIARAAAEEAERLKRFARQEIEEQVRGVVRELKSYGAARAAALARERIRKRMTPELHARLIDKSIDALSRRHEERAGR